ncbi:phytoene desaturase family protein [Candidatus Palauibacter sp.]|uniref:phytoene desaturase family protein n=1 Tax=Candidatus Palauibacter sp. TaxID=3101350 RepID=UPI003B59E0DD
MSGCDAVVIGAGHNGLIAAAYLARAGLRVVVVERGETPGGCAATEELWPGYRVDTGAHSLTGIDARVMADLDLAGPGPTPGGAGSKGAGLEIMSSDPCVVAPQPEGGALVLERDPARTAESIRRFSPRDAARWPDFVSAMARASRVLSVLYDTLPPRLAGADRGDLWELLRLGARMGRVGRRDALELMRLIPMTVEELLWEWFESEALKGALAADGVRGICQGPLASGTGYMFLHHMVGAGGVVRRRRQVRGGMGTLGAALQRVAVAAGAEVRLGHEVASIRVEDGRATGIVLAGGGEITASRVVSSADPGRTLLGLVDPGELAPEFVRALENIKYRGVVAKMHLALGEPPRLPSGNTRTADAPADDDAAQAALLAGAAITIAPSIHYIERAYDGAKYGRPSERPVLDAVLTTALDPSLAPEGRHILSVAAQYAPFRLKEGAREGASEASGKDASAGAWDEARREALGDAVVSTLSACAPNIEGAILHRHVLTPADLADRFALPEGNIHHGEMTLDQVFFGRPVGGWARYRTPIEGLYLCGAGTHPGGGLNGRPGAAAATRILRDLK